MLALSASHGQCRVKASKSSSPQRKAGLSTEDLPPSSDDEGSSDGEDYDQSLDSATAIEDLAGERGIASSIILSGSVFVNMLAILFLGLTEHRFHGNAYLWRLIRMCLEKVYFQLTRPRKVL